MKTICHNTQFGNYLFYNKKLIKKNKIKLEDCKYNVDVVQYVSWFLIFSGDVSNRLLFFTLLFHKCNQFFIRIKMF